MERIVNLHIEKLPEGIYLATSDAIQGLVAQGRTIQETIDIALIPYWYFLNEEGKRVVRDHIRARKVIAIHIGTEERTRRDIEKIRSEFPGIDLATKPGERWTF